ncbi:hypothetical protein [Streptomyces sp. NPDC056821]
MSRDVVGFPQAGGVFFEQGQDSVSAALGGGGMAVVQGGGGQRGLRF